MQQSSAVSLADRDQTRGGPVEEGCVEGGKGVVVYQCNKEALHTYPNGVLTFPMTSLILGVMILPFWCLAVGGHCPSHSASSSTPCRKREGERRKDATGLATILTVSDPH